MPNRHINWSAGMLDEEKRPANAIDLTYFPPFVRPRHFWTQPNQTFISCHIWPFYYPQKKLATVAQRTEKVQSTGSDLIVFPKDFGSVFFISSSAWFIRSSHSSFHRVIISAMEHQFECHFQLGHHNEWLTAENLWTELCVTYTYLDWNYVLKNNAYVDAVLVMLCCWTDKPFI